MLEDCIQGIYKDIEFHIKYLIFDTVYIDNFIFLIVTLYSLNFFYQEYILRFHNEMI